MKGAVLRELGGPNSVRIEDVPVPTADSEVVIRIRAAALNRRDLFITYGQYPGIELPSIMGSDGAGEIAALPACYDGDLAVGEDVVILPSFDWGEDLRCQSRQFTTLGVPRDGTFAEYVSVPAQYVYRMPSHLSYAEAAALPLAGLTAFRALTTRGRLQPGETVLIPGVGGGVAGFAVQFAAAMGAQVYVTSRIPEHIALSIELGAVGGVITTDENWGKQLKAMVPHFDLVVDSIGGELFPSLVRLVRPGGRLVTFGATAGPVPNLVLPHIFLKQIDVLGTSMGNAKEFGQMLELVIRSDLRPHVSSRYPLAEVREAMKSMEAGAPAGKIILEP